MLSRIAFIIVFASALPALAQDSEVIFGDQPDGVSAGDLLRPAQMGNLQRVVASLESTLDVYRLALAEVAIAAQLLADLGAEPGAVPDRAIPATARDVFNRLSRVLASRVPAAALAPIPRGYHFEALDALENLAAASTFSEVRKPLTALTRSVERLGDVADEVVDLFSRQRPIQVQIFDADTALAQISDALEAVALAERRILALRKKKAGLNEQFQAFLFLEISLGNALDLIAAAEEAGINVGFELQLELERFKTILARVRERQSTLEDLVARIDTAPEASLREPVAWILDSKLRVAFSPRPGPGLAAFRVETAIDRERADAQNEARVRCGGEASEVKDTEFKLLSYLPADANQVEVPLVAAPGAPIRVRVTPVNAFAAAAEPVEIAPVWVSAAPSPPAWVTATVTDVSPYDSEFYRDFDEVVIEWPGFGSDPPANVRARLPEIDFAARIVIFRGEEQVATLKPGQRRFVERAPVEWLQAGAQYSVQVVTVSGETVRSSPCPELDIAQRDARYELQLASAGARYLERPSLLERDVATRLRGDLAKRDELWSKAEEDSALLDQWWHGVPEAKRLEWLDRWVELHGGRESLWFLRAPALGKRDREWVLASMWLETQDRVVRKEVDRVWKLLHPSRRGDVERRWFESRDVEWRTKLAAQLGSATEEVRAQLLAPARIRYWVSTKDPEEFRTVEVWWEALEAETQNDVLVEWLGRQPAELRAELRWPAWVGLENDERAARMETAYRELPPGLRPEFLAWWRFEQLAGDERVTAVAADVGALRAGWERLRYRTRSFDRATGFNGVLVYGAIVLVLPVPIVWLRRRRRSEV
ncbi:MAG: hypothetical protein AAF654_03270 [Myxococcota bacterium]